MCFRSLFGEDCTFFCGIIIYINTVFFLHVCFRSLFGEDCTFYGIIIINTVFFCMCFQKFVWRRLHSVATTIIIITTFVSFSFSSCVSEARPHLVSDQANRAGNEPFSSRKMETETEIIVSANANPKVVSSVCSSYLLVHRGFLVLAAIPNNVHAKEISTLRCNVFTVESGSRRIRRGGFCVEKNCADLSSVRVDCLSELVQLFLQSVSRSSFCSLSHQSQAAGRFCNLQDKRSRQKNRKESSSFSSSRLWYEISAPLSLSLFRSLFLCLFLTELRRFLFLFWFSKLRSLERTGIEAWNSLLLDDVHRITEKDFHQKISTCVLLQNSITKLFAHRQRGGGQTLVERAKEKEWRQHVRQQRPWLEEEEEELLNCFWRKRQRQEEEGRRSNSKWWWELLQQHWRTHASLCCEHCQRKLLPSLDAVSIPISLSLSLSPSSSANTSCSHQNNCHWQFHRMELWNSLHSYYYTEGFFSAHRRMQHILCFFLFSRVFSVPQ